MLAQRWTEGKRRILIICPANLRKQWSQEMADKFFLPTTILESAVLQSPAQGRCSEALRAADDRDLLLPVRGPQSDELMVTKWDLAVLDEAHRLRSVYRTDNKTGRALKGALANAPKILLTATPLQNSLMELYGLVS